MGLFRTKPGVRFSAHVRCRFLLRRYTKTKLLARDSASAQPNHSPLRKAKGASGSVRQGCVCLCGATDVGPCCRRHCAALAKHTLWVGCICCAVCSWSVCFPKVATALKPYVFAVLYGFTLKTCEYCARLHTARLRLCATASGVVCALPDERRGGRVPHDLGEVLP